MTQLKIIKKAAIICGTLVLIALLSNRPSVAMGLIFGTLVGILNLRLLAMALMTAVRLSPQRARVYAVSRYLLRYLIIALVLYAAARKGDISFFFATGGGLLLMKFAALWEGILG